MLSLIIPAFDEAERLPKSLKVLNHYFVSKNEEHEVIVVSDGSTDATCEVVRSFQSIWPELKLIDLPANQGKGAAVQAGMLQAKGQVRAFSDADLSCPVEEIEKLRSFLNGKCQVAFASRALAESKIEKHQPWHREMMGKVFNKIIQVLVLPGIQDTQCGLKVFTDKAAVTCFKNLRTMRFGFDVEVLMRAKRAGYKVQEVPVSWHHEDASKVSAIRDSLETLIDIIKLRFILRKERKGQNY